MFEYNKDFFPTPKKLIDKMLQDIDFKLINSVLEPSAGKGDLAEAVKQRLKFNGGYNRKDFDIDIDTIELDQNLQHILKGNSFRVVHDDFLTYNSLKSYDLIIMNPPFSNGEKHLLKALEMQEKGGQVVCILNAETLRNAYSNTRKDLLNRLDQHNAQIEYIADAFLDAERKTYVEVALIKIAIEKPEHNSTILNELKQEERHEKTINSHNSSQVVDADFIKGIIARYNFEVKTGLKLIEEYEALKPHMLNSFKDDYMQNPVLELKLHSDKYNNHSSNAALLANEYIKQIRMKYWRTLFTSDQFIGLFTSNLRQQYLDKVSELRDYDFSLFNIYTIKAEMHKEMITAVEETILSLFEELSNKFHWYDETSKNIHYYNGWKTNKSYKINKKVIIPLNAYSWSNNYNPSYTTKDKLSDIEKVFNYLDGGLTEEVNLYESLKMAEHYGETKKIECKYFLVTFYKKGTCHIEFVNKELLHKFNLYGSQRKGWLPPSYGKEHYNSMTAEEKTVIDEFEGKESYNKVMQNKDYYLVESEKLLLLA